LPVSTSSDSRMASRRSSSRLLKPLLYTTGAAAAGGLTLYAVYRPRNIPGTEDAVIPPPVYGEPGAFTPPTFPEIKSRAEQIADLKKSAGTITRSASDSLKGLMGMGGQQSPESEGEEDPYDLLIIGGGATGSGIALDAATRGLKVALVERDDFASGTSSKSTKLVHGGVRYLEKAVWNLDYGQFNLVREALRERRYFLDTAPHLSSWLPIMLPLDKWYKAPYYWLGTKVYDFLAGSENIESSYFLTKNRALNAFPMLRKDNLFGALVYYGRFLSHCNWERRDC
jgi:glycerol-3-phosphate dehydrogenase